VPAGQWSVSKRTACAEHRRPQSPASSWKRGRLIEAALDLGDVFSLKALRSLLNLELNKLTFVERFVSIHLDRREMDEDVVSRLALDKSKSL